VRRDATSSPPRRAEKTPTAPLVNHSTAILGLYAAAAFLASLVGGSLPSLFRLTHTRMQTALSFIGGLMLGMALLHMIPHAAEQTHSADRAMRWALGGFIAMFVLQRIFHYHQHAAPDEVPSHTAGRESDVVSMPNAGHKLRWIAVAMGVGFHSVLDGLALATVVAAHSCAGMGLVGLGTALAVILHKPFDALAVLTLMHASGCRAGLKRAMNVGIALVVPLGALVAAPGLGSLAEAEHELLGCLLGFCGGGFLCIACSDLLPELHFHSHDRWRLSLALAVGLGIAILLGACEGHGHNHDCDGGEVPPHLQHGIHSNAFSNEP